MEDIKQLPIDYVTKDQAGFMQMMKDVIPSLTPEWTDLSDTDQGIVMLQALAYGLHILGYYQDKGVNENFLHTASTKRAILLGCKFLGYTPRKQSPAVVPLEFKKESFREDEYLVIAKGTKVSTNPEMGDPIVFETDEPLILPEGVLVGTVNATQGESSLREVIGKGNNQQSQKFQLERADVIEETLVIVTNENGKDYVWTLVENLLESKPNDRHYMTEIDEDNITTCIFGTGVTGMKPPLDVNVYASYRHGGGLKGNVAKGKINYLYDRASNGIESVINTEDATGGEDYEDISHAQAVAPRAHRTRDRAVTAQDHADLAETIAGVSKAICIETFDKDNNVNLYIANTNYEPATTALIDKVFDEISRVRVVNSKLNVFSCQYKTFDIGMKVFIHDSFIPSDVKEEVVAEIRKFLHPRNFKLGETVYLSQIVQKAFFAQGVRNVVITAPATDIECAYNELPKLREVTVEMIGGVQNVTG